MTTNQDAINAGARALFDDAIYTFPAEATYIASVAYAAMAPIIAAQAKAEALREFAEDIRDFDGEKTLRNHIANMARARAAGIEAGK